VRTLFRKGGSLRPAFFLLLRSFHVTPRALNPLRRYTTRMRSTHLPPLAILAGILVSCTAAFAQLPQTIVKNSQPEIACRAYPLTSESFKHKLWDGYEISLGPVHSTELTEFVCTAAIYNREGKVVYRTSGFNVTFDDHLTGQDFDDDGHPEVVFETDTGGGNHCCWEYNVISLYPKPHKLFDIPQQGLVQFEKDAQEKMVIWVRTQGPGGALAMASRPFAERVYRVRDGKLADATPEFCARIFSTQDSDFRHWTAELTPENLQRITAVSEPDQPAETEEIASALLARAAQHVFCRQYDDAIADLELWPAATRAKMKADFAASIKDDYPDFAARLAEASPTH
jgi:hypothetical protein